MFLSLTCRLIAAALVVCIASGCTPDYNWRVFTDANHRYTVMFPARVVSTGRQVVLAGLPMPMRMSVARVACTIFAVGVVTLPRDDARLRAQVLEEMAASVARNISVKFEGKKITLRYGEAGERVVGVAFKARASLAEHKPAAVEAQFVAHGTHVYQVVIVSEKMLAQEQEETFFDSFTIY